MYSTQRKIPFKLTPCESKQRSNIGLLSVVGDFFGLPSIDDSFGRMHDVDDHPAHSVCVTELSSSVFAPCWRLTINEWQIAVVVAVLECTSAGVLAALRCF